MSLLQINTAIPLAEPLLEHQQLETERSATRRDSSESNSGHRTKFVVLGALTGFFIQVVSLGAYAFLLVHYQSVPFQVSGEVANAEVTALTKSGIFSTPEDDNEEGIFGTDTILYTILSVLTQVDLVVYVLIWVAFTCTMTNNGMSCIRSQFFANEEDDFEAKKSSSDKDNKIIKRRYVFVLGVYFLVGIVIGAFGAWSAIDVYLGFPIPFKPILTTVTVDLVLCYLMVWCYDLGKNKRRRSINDNSNEEQQIEFSTNYDSDDDEDCEPAMCC